MIKLQIRDKKGKFRTYTQSWVPTRYLLEAADYSLANYPEINDLILKTSEFIVKVMGNQFTVDDILDGVASDKWMDFANDFSSQLYGGDDPEIQPGKE